MLALDFEPRFDPGVDPPVQRSYALEAELLEPLRDLDRRRLVRARAVDDYLAVDRHAFESRSDVLHVDRARTGDAARGCLSDRRAHVNERLHGVLLHHVA